MSYEKLREHLGHEVVIARYGTDSQEYNIALECEECYEVIVDYDTPVK